MQWADLSREELIRACTELDGTLSYERGEWLEVREALEYQIRRLEGMLTIAEEERDSAINECIQLSRELDEMCQVLGDSIQEVKT